MSKKKIRIVSAMFIAGELADVGDELDVDAQEAHRMVKSGRAEWVEDKPVPSKKAEKPAAKTEKKAAPASPDKSVADPAAQVDGFSGQPEGGDVVTGQQTDDQDQS